MANESRLSPEQRQRVLQGLEITLFIAAALMFQAFHPWWMWPTAVQSLLTTGLFLGAFLLYVAVRGQRLVRRPSVTNQLPRAPSATNSQRSVSDVPRESSGQYQVPRRFSLASMCGITLACALLVAALRSLHAPPVVAGCVLAFFAFIGSSQMVLHRVPRAASSLVGLVLALIAVSISKTAVTLVEAFSPVAPLTAPVLFLAAAMMGAFFGYFAGVFAAAIFLIGDSFRCWLRGANWAESPPDVS